jgi:hypothetical protein
MVSNIPGLGEGTLFGSTANQLSLLDRCSLKRPSKAKKKELFKLLRFWTSTIEKNYFCKARALYK